MATYDLDLAHKYSNNHKPELEKDKKCGCFYCLKIFSPSEIKEWIIEDNPCDKLGTAICPYCEIDSVIGESSGFPINEDFLAAMHERWFGENEGRTIQLEEDVVAMASEPIPDVEPSELLDWYASHHSEQGLAEAYAAAHNKAWWVEDNIYDYEEGTPDHKQACDITDAWFFVEEKLREQIFAILRSEGVSIPEKGYITVLTPFMNRNGFIDGNGWWIPTIEE